MVIFHSYVSLPEGTSSLWYPNDIPSISPWSPDLGPGEVPRWAWARDESTARHKEGAPEWAPQPGIFTVKNDMTDIGGEASEKWWEFPCFHGFLFQMSPKFLLVDSSGKNFNGFHILHTSSSVGRPTTPNLWGCFWSPWSPSPRGGPKVGAFDV